MFENLANFRDIGGRPVDGGGEVRSGRLFRSDSVAYASAADARRLHADLGLATVIDLRGERETARYGRGPLADLPIGYVHVPITDVGPGGGDLADFYLAVLDQRGAMLADLLRGLLAPGALPAVVHCEAGCDRTGVVTAVLLGLLGVPDEVIIADFDLTREALPAMNARWRRFFLADERNLPEDWVEETWGEREAAMVRTAARVRQRWGGWEGWASTYGLTAPELTALRALLVTPPP